ncbi:Metalloendopeptidase family-saccharolysin & thimet oligopeptidase (ISS) [Chlorella sorokiniana]|uniref:Metalloendopeptidase family-saccharolysin & thimet oligopeptidase (ISS) n=1 Tax=Chlorella sorokiniana TaxID=3076 RepID=A0A2P6U248_CHLSO|nr:Metalloendopeptidase family-saccharolysin & thimet oligopeptidase (ISS) [Chlorella sorokiniana]|eukprot:PRW60370.1 Metalloendopeptidase family-saccharolysin & thimet oligopeptidase (ISS) [Chlorella sorokiniana]
MQATVCGSAGQLASRSSAFAGSRPAVAAFSSAQPRSGRGQLQVVAAKGKQRMRTGGNTRQAQMAQMQMAPPTPPVDPENEEFVVFVRSKKLPQWVPLSVVKGGTAANMLVKGLGSDLMKERTEKTLVQNIGKAVYKDKEQIIASLRKSYPPFKETKEFEFAFKIRDRTVPKEWYLPKNLYELPPEAELEKTPAENISDFFGNTFGGFLGGNKKE